MKRYLILLLALLLLTGCRTAEVRETESLPEIRTKTETQPETIPETERKTEIPASETEPLETETPEREKPEPFARLVSGEENFVLSTVTIPGDFRMCWEYDDTHMLYMTWTPVVVRRKACWEMQLYMVDLTAGAIIARGSWTGDVLWDSLNGNMIYHYRLDQSTGIAYADNPMLLHIGEDGTINFLSATSTVASPPVLEVHPYPFVSSDITSPDGRYHVQQTIDDMAGHGGLDLLYSDLTTVRLFEAVMLDDTMANGKKAGIHDVRIYNPIGFLDETRFVYRIGGWEWTIGYGIWDLVTGQYTEYTGFGIAGVHDGYLYLTENRSTQQYMVTHIYKASPAGEKTLIASADKEDGVFWIENTDEYFSVPRYESAYWITSVPTDPDRPDIQRCAIWSPDLEKELAVMESLQGTDWYLREGQITVVLCEETETVSDENPVTAQTGLPEPYIRLTAGADTFTASMVILRGGEWADWWKWDDTHILWMTYDRIAGEHNETLGHTNRYLSMLNLETGQITAVLPLDGTEELNEVTWDGKDMILYHLVLDKATTTYTAENALRITYENGILSAEPTEIVPFPVVTKQIHSPDGQYTVRQYVDDGWERGYMDLVYPDGSSVLLFTGTVLDDILPDGRSAGIEDVRGYTPLAFLDDTRFVYTIGGWEHCRGYGIYDLTTGTFTEFTEDVEYVYTVHEGYIYMISIKRLEDRMCTEVWKATPAGERTLLASSETDTSLFPLRELYDPLYCAGPYWIYTTEESLFSGSVDGKGKPNIYQVWSPDMDSIQAEFILDGHTMNRVFFCGTQITYVP
ncbi:MAG: hypothetical protein IKV57_07970 [Clostridia bacterium]|nr:hypothetical protein [Clostridia bacterium]